MAFSDLTGGNSSANGSDDNSSSNAPDRYRNGIRDIYREETGRDPQQGALDWYTRQAESKGLNSGRESIANSLESSIFDETGTPLRVSSNDQVDGFDYRNSGRYVIGEPEEQEEISGDYVRDLGVGDRTVPNTEVTSDQTVQGQLAQILDGDSPLMQRVGNKAKQAANSRGLLNSSMAEQAAQGAMIDQAAGIASQDAQTFFQNNQANAGRDMTDYTQRLGFEQGLAQTAQEYGLRSDILTQEFEQGLEQTAQEYGLRSDILAQEGDQVMEKLYGTSLANAWGVMGNNVTDIVAQTMQNIQAIQNNPNINAEDKTRMIQDALDMRDQDVQFQADLYSTLPDTLDDIGVFPERVT